MKALRYRERIFGMRLWCGCHRQIYPCQNVSKTGCCPYVNFPLIKLLNCSRFLKVQHTIVYLNCLQCSDNKSESTKQKQNPKTFISISEIAYSAVLFLKNTIFKSRILYCSHGCVLTKQPTITVRSTHRCRTWLMSYQMPCQRGKRWRSTWAVW